MKKIIWAAILILVLLILASCQWRSKTNTISQKYSETYDGRADYLGTTYRSEEEFLAWLDSQKNFDEKYRSLFAIDKVRFKMKKIPEGYHFSSINVMMNQVTYTYKMENLEVYMNFHYVTMHYYDIDKGSQSKTFEQTMDHFDEIIEKDNKIFYVGYPKTLHDKVLRGSIRWNMDSYECTIYTVGIGSFDESIFDYCDYEKIPLNRRNST